MLSLFLPEVTGHKSIVQLFGVGLFLFFQTFQRFRNFPHRQRSLNVFVVKAVHLRLTTLLQRVAAASRSVPAAAATAAAAVAAVVAHVAAVSRRGFLQIVSAFFDGRDFFPLQFVHLFHQQLQFLVLRPVAADARVHVPREQKEIDGCKYIALCKCLKVLLV